MRIKNVYIFLSLTLLFACKSYEPFQSLKEKKSTRQIIKKEFQLSKNEFKKIKNQDSILFLVSRSLKGKIKHKLIERRLDSFFVNNYTENQLLILLKLDYNFPFLKKPIELNKTKNADGISIKNMEEMKMFLRKGGLEVKLDSVLGIKRKDSIKKKN